MPAIKKGTTEQQHPHAQEPSSKDLTGPAPSGMTYMLARHYDSHRRTTSMYIDRVGPTRRPRVHRQPNQPTPVNHQDPCTTGASNPEAPRGTSLRLGPTHSTCGKWG